MNKNWMQTHSGKAFWPEHPEQHKFCPVDIATALSRQPRYGGHTRRFYSVAEHTMILCDFAYDEYEDPQMAYWTLHHDDSEAYLGDMPNPLKVLCPDYKALEKKCESALQDHFRLRMPDHIKSLDYRILLDEKKSLMGREPAPWNVDGVPLGVRLWEWRGRFPGYLKWQWLRRHVLLCAQLGYPDHMP